MEGYRTLDKDMRKKNPRQANKTLLIYTEGKHEEVFLIYVTKYLYTIRGCGQQINIVAGTGGSPHTILDKAIQHSYKEHGEVYDYTIVVVDRDMIGGEDKFGDLRKKAKENNIILVIFEPCLEALLLSILEDGKDFSEEYTGCRALKEQFHKNYLDEEKRTDSEEYEEYFSLTKIETARKRTDHNSQQLDFLIKAMHNQLDLDKEI